MTTIRQPRSTPGALTSRLRFLYEAEHAAAHRFRYGLLVFDVLTILFIVASSFLERTPLIAAIDVLLGLVILADFSARLAISRTRLRDLCQPSTWADVVAILSFLAARSGHRQRRPHGHRILAHYGVAARHGEAAAEPRQQTSGAVRC
jgi:hypothetical protein